MNPKLELYIFEDMLPPAPFRYTCSLVGGWEVVSGRTGTSSKSDGDKCSKIFEG